jgi:hypothetical protein
VVAPVVVAVVVVVLVAAAVVVAPVVGQSLIHRSDLLTWPRATISVTLGALLSRLVRPI